MARTSKFIEEEEIQLFNAYADVAKRITFEQLQRAPLKSLTCVDLDLYQIIGSSFHGA